MFFFRCDFKTFILQVLDVNEFAPAFLRSHYSITIREDTSVGYHLLSIQADDHDSRNHPVLWENKVRTVVEREKHCYVT